MSHRRPPNRRKLVGLALLAVAALAVAAAAAFQPGNSPIASPLKSAHTAAAALAAGSAPAPEATPTRTRTRTAAAEAVQPHHVVLVVGDSLIGQADTELRADSTANFSVNTAFWLGSAPCDWVNGRFDAELDTIHPDIVVLAFVGNAGLSPGCVSSNDAYPLTELLGNYRVNLTTLADRATASGAKVIIVTPPARNPQAPPPPNTPTIGEIASPNAFYGFQGVSEIRDLYREMANSSGGRWQLTDAPALAISPGWVYKEILSCNAGDGSCPDGFVAVRKGRDDAIHLDSEGNGAKRYAKALVSSVAAITNHTAGA